jgi:glutamate synthase (NADPH/NADH) small chain
MGRPRGFLEIRRSKAEARPVAERVFDWRELDLAPAEPALREQAARCMDCGVPFCMGGVAPAVQTGCPLGNLIPDFNDLVMKGRWAEASAELHATNNFPEVTGRVCPAPCEGSCVLALASVPAEGGRAAPGPVTIKAIEREVADRAMADGSALAPRVSAVRSGRRVAVVGSGPAGLACAQQLARRGHDVTVYERDDRVGGLLRYGIPDFKLEKAALDARVRQMTAEGVVFRTGVGVGEDVSGETLRAGHDAVVLCGGAMVPRALEAPGVALEGVVQAMVFLTQQNRRVAGDLVPDRDAVLATGRRVVVLGGGDTGSDCVGTALRQGARSVTSLELMPRPPDERAAGNAWPAWPMVFRTSSSHEEGGAREFGVMTKRVRADAHGRVEALEVVRVERRGEALVEVEGSGHDIPCELLLLAMGFVGSSREGLLSQLGVGLDGRGNVVADDHATTAPGVFVAGDMRRGASLVVWAIAEGRRAAERVDAWLERAPGS